MLEYFISVEKASREVVSVISTLHKLYDKLTDQEKTDEQNYNF